MVQFGGLIIAHPKATFFAEFKRLLKEAARQGTMHLSFNLKPEYPEPALSLAKVMQDWSGRAE